MRLKNFYVTSLAIFGTALQGCGPDSAAFLLATGNGSNSRGARSGAEQFRAGGVSIDPSIMRQTQDPGIKPKDLGYEYPSESASAELKDIPSAEVLRPKDSASNRPPESRENLYVKNNTSGSAGSAGTTGTTGTVDEDDEDCEESNSHNGGGITHGNGPGPRRQAEEVNGISVNNSGSSLLLRPSQTQLWPPNHKLVSVSVQGHASSACQIVNVTDNESDRADDAIITGALTVDLRATRSGTSMNGRIYSIELSCIYARSDRSEEHLEVVVPHDQGKGK
jgi:hypothetical protein